MGSNSLLGVFDSGVGGFSVLKEIRKVTNVDISYYGDCANAPYGNKTQDEIVAFIKQILIYLKSQGVTHYVSACNSMSVNTTEQLLQEVGIDSDLYIDMIDGVMQVPFADGANVLIVGTEATISSRVYQSILSEKTIAHKTFSSITLAGAIEVKNTDMIMKNIKEIITLAKEMHATHILYACTHYPLVDIRFKECAAQLGWAGMFVNPAAYIAQLVDEWKLKGENQITFETSLETEVFNFYIAKFS